MELRFLLKQSLLGFFKHYSDPILPLLTLCTQPNMLALFQRLKRCQIHISHPCRSIKQGSHVYHRITGKFFVLLFLNGRCQNLLQAVAVGGTCLEKKRLILFTSKHRSYLGRLNYCILTNVVLWKQLTRNSIAEWPHVCSV